MAVTAQGKNGEALLVGLDKDDAVVWSWYCGEPGPKEIPFADMPPNVVTVELRILGADGGSGGSAGGGVANMMSASPTSMYYPGGGGGNKKAPDARGTEGC